MDNLRVFQSTLPVKGATPEMQACWWTDGVSIHAPSEGSDMLWARWLAWAWFQSTLPVKGATYPPINTRKKNMFQSTLPVKGATSGLPRLSTSRGVSIHAPSEGSDRSVVINAQLVNGFNPRSQ